MTHLGDHNRMLKLWLRWTYTPQDRTRNRSGACGPSELHSKLWRVWLVLQYVVVLVTFWSSLDVSIDCDQVMVSMTCSCWLWCCMRK